MPNAIQNVAVSQISIIDITDSYTVTLSSESFTFVGDTSGKLPSQQLCTTNIYCLQGGTGITPTSVTASTLENLETTIGTLGSTTSVQFKCKTNFTGGEVILTVKFGSGSEAITFTKHVSFAVTKSGAAGKDGKDAISMAITTNNGTVFRNNAGSTTLTAHVFKGGVELTVADNGQVHDGSTLLGTVRWYQDNTSLGVSSNEYEVNALNVALESVFDARLEEETT